MRLGAIQPWLAYGVLPVLSMRIVGVCHLLSRERQRVSEVDSCCASQDAGAFWSGHGELNLYIHFC